MIWRGVTGTAGTCARVGTMPVRAALMISGSYGLSGCGTCARVGGRASKTAAMVPTAAGPRGMSGSGDIHVAGTGSFALEVAEYARAAGFEVIGLIELLDPARVGSEVHGLPVCSPDDPPSATPAVVIGAGGDRMAHWEPLGAHGWRAATVVHPAAHVSTSARLGDGSVVAPGAVVGAASELGAHVLLGR